MSQKLKNDLQIWRLAADLSLTPNGDPVGAIVAFCNKRIHSILREFNCTTLSELLTAVAARLDTLFIEIHDDTELERVRHEYLARHEAAFAALQHQLSSEVYAITFKLAHPRLGDRRYVSVIDCRGSKSWRCYFSKWHELAHLLTLTQQARLRFCRTHAEPETKDPEEVMMDVIAGEVGFFAELVRAHATGDISFDTISELREKLCPDASQQASLIGFVRAWPQPCVVVQARLGLRAHERRARSQQAFEFREAPAEALRAIHVTANAAAERAGILIHTNMRIPERSVIHKVFTEGLRGLEADENLGWWESSNGRGLDAQPVLVKARRRWDSVDALFLRR